jgi:NAD(P)-dependent dehydrogenase (short-subunit alcohol dehydrogenase family)
VSENGSVVVIGGTAGLGLETARAFAKRGVPVVISGRSLERAERAAHEIGGARGIAIDLTRPAETVAALSIVDNVRHLVITAIERDRNTVRDYDVAAAVRLVTLKLVGYTAVVHALAPRMSDESSIVLLGGLAMTRPYPGSTTVTTVNGGISALVRTLAVELAPIRVNALHPTLIGDSPYWAGNPAVLDAVRARVPTHRLVTTEDVVHAVLFLTENRSVNGANLNLDGGELLS